MRIATEEFFSVM